MTWQPIETAPKDGTTVDLWRGERLTDMRRVVFAPDNVFYEPVSSGYTCVRDATHWMPLPKPPIPDEGCYFQEMGERDRLAMDAQKP